MGCRLIWRLILVIKGIPRGREMGLANMSRVVDTQVGKPAHHLSRLELYGENVGIIVWTLLGAGARQNLGEMKWYSNHQT